MLPGLGPDGSFIGRPPLDPSLTDIGGQRTRPRSGGILDHPRGLVYLSVAEGWERFSYFGMQSLLVLYLTHYLLLPDRVGGVVGIGALRGAVETVTGPLSPAAFASQIFGLYGGLVYLTPLFGGLLADRLVSRTRIVTAGALLMAAGHFLMAFEWAFLVAIVLLLVGVGCFKGNIASQVGSLYQPGDPRRASAFQIFQLSISTAVILSPLITGTLGEKVGWHYGFGAAGVGMVAGLAIYLRGRRWLPPDPELRAARGKRPAEGFTPRQWKTVALLLALIPVLAGVSVGNQQMFNAFVVWGEASFDLRFAGFAMPVTWLLSADAVIAVGCQVAALVFWQACARRGREPVDIVKIAIGAAAMAAAPLLLAAASLRHAATGAAISPGWGLGFELINEIGFALVAPVGLSLFSRAAPARIQGLMIGLYYAGYFLSNLTVGWLGGLLERMEPAGFWLLHAGIVAVAGLLVAGVAVWGRRLLMPAET